MMRLCCFDLCSLSNPWMVDSIVFILKVRKQGHKDLKHTLAITFLIIQKSHLAGMRIPEFSGKGDTELRWGWVGFPAGVLLIEGKFHYLRLSFSS